MAIEAARIATKFMTPVMLLSDGYLANGAEPWLLPELSDFKPFPPTFVGTDGAERPEDWHAYLRDPDTLARVWAKPGTPGYEHRLGGLEKHYDSGNISYDPDNHHRMTKVRAQKVANVANDIPLLEVDEGAPEGKLLVLGWGSTFGSIRQAVRSARAKGLEVSHAHLRYLNPMPKNTAEVLAKFDRVLVPEMNNGMLVRIIRSEFLIDAIAHDKIAGQPFKVSEIEDAIQEHYPGTVSRTSSAPQSGPNS